MWESERFGLVRVSRKGGDSTEVVVEIAGYPKAFGNLENPKGNTGTMYFPEVSSCNQCYDKQKDVHVFTWN